MFACLPHISVISSLTTCHENQFRIVFESLSMLNATPQLNYYSSHRASVDDMLQGKADILLTLITMNARESEYLLFSNVFEFRHETFYAWRAKEESTVSFFALISSSKAACMLLLLTASVAWLALAFVRFLQLEHNSLSQVLVDSLVSIVGTFFSVAEKTWDTNGKPFSRRYICSHQLVFAVWVLGMFPFSVYFRGELTSRLTARLPPNNVDTLDKLRSELDKQRILPCVVKGSPFYWHIHDKNRTNDATLYAKLREAYERNDGGLKLTFKYVDSCFRCAKRPGFVCFLTAQNDCRGSNLGPEIVESRERLNLALISTPARKDFPQARAYGNLLQRIFETGLNYHSFNSRRDCVDQTGNEEHSGLVALVGEAQGSQFSELAEFFTWFSALLGLSAVLLATELSARFLLREKEARARHKRHVVVC